MRFLIDNALSPGVAQGLKESGHDVRHVRDVGIQDADDEVIFERAAEEERIIISADTDFGTLLAGRSAKKPSVILFRHGATRVPKEQVSLILANIASIEAALEEGAVVVIGANRIRVRPLPLMNT